MKAKLKTLLKLAPFYSSIVSTSGHIYSINSYDLLFSRVSCLSIRLNGTVTTAVINSNGSYRVSVRNNKGHVLPGSLHDPKTI